MLDVTNTYLKGCSPYISNLTYDVNQRVLVLECVNNPNDFIPSIQIICEGVKTYSEETIDEEYDDRCIDSVIGINWIGEKTLCIHTEKKEIIIEVEYEPQIKQMTADFC